MRSNESGVTIVELLISVAVASMISTIMLVISLNFFGSTVRSQVTAEMAADAHYLLRAVIEDIRVADSLAVTNSLPDANAPAGGWLTSEANNSLVLNLPAIDGNRDIIYDDTTSSPHTNQIIYFIDDGIFYKRFLENTAASGNIVTTTCPSAVASSSCPPDREYAAYVQDMALTFYDVTNAETSDPSLARSVRVGISMERKVFGDTVRINNSILTKLRN